ncbi:hypothetical protein AVEN_236684-1 [Araneus ventricosus]|uniref:Uncharacterized protein n=1 Tax=Araneus ventricosus TaxID=182803 RepID=A0A4Y2X516_ARAVE|nr:hypothetical protein AVEN_236684-1 [Araneus ventricosus]
MKTSYLYHLRRVSQDNRLLESSKRKPHSSWLATRVRRGTAWYPGHVLRHLRCGFRPLVASLIHGWGAPPFSSTSFGKTLIFSSCL